jgi:hypothetical protein
MLKILQIQRTTKSILPNRERSSRTDNQLKLLKKRRRVEIFELEIPSFLNDKAIVQKNKESIQLEKVEIQCSCAPNVTNEKVEDRLTFSSYSEIEKINLDDKFKEIEMRRDESFTYSQDMIYECFGTNIV